MSVLWKLHFFYFRIIFVTLCYSSSMSINSSNILHIVSQLTDDKKVRVPNRVAEAADIASQAAAGGFIMGPIGMLIGV